MSKNILETNESNVGNMICNWREIISYGFGNKVIIIKMETHSSRHGLIWCMRRTIATSKECVCFSPFVVCCSLNEKSSSQSVRFFFGCGAGTRTSLRGSKLVRSTRWATNGHGLADHFRLKVGRASRVFHSRIVELPPVGLPPVLESAQLEIGRFGLEVLVCESQI